MNTIVPAINSFDNEIKENKIAPFDESIVIIEEDVIKVKPNFNKDDFYKICFDLSGLDLLNSLESFSLFFTSGIAEDEIGYLTIGHSFCSTVKRYLPLIVVLSEGIHYLNLIKLYKIWNTRIEKENLEKEKKKIEIKLNQKKEIKISSIGTK